MGHATTAHTKPTPGIKCDRPRWLLRGDAVDDSAGGVKNSDSIFKRVNVTSAEFENLVESLEMASSADALVFEAFFSIFEETDRHERCLRGHLHEFVKGDD